MQTISDSLTTTNSILRSAGISSARLDAEVLLAHTLNADRAWLIAHGDDVLTAEKAQIFNDLVARRVQCEPIAYLTGRKEFYGREFIVTSDVLIPRPETEVLIDIVKQLVAPEAGAKRLLDIGTGSGCIGITCKLELPELGVTLSDISPQALAIARKNAAKLGTKPIRYIQSDLLSHWLHHSNPKTFDIIVANLPYVDRTWPTSPELRHEPELALYADEQGLKLIKTLISQAPNLLAPGGSLLIEADPSQHAAVTKHSKNYGFSHVMTRDYIVVLQR